MFYNHLFWITLILLFCSALNIKIYFSCKQFDKILLNSIGLFGLIGLIAAHINLIILSLQFNWWWFFSGVCLFLLGVGIFSYLFRSRVKIVFGILNFLFIPFLWWYGSKFNTILSTDWFYDLVEGIRNLFA